jgi:hypothetical protein
MHMGFVRALLLVAGIGMALVSYVPGCGALLPAGVALGLLGAGLPILAELGG